MVISVVDVNQFKSNFLMQRKKGFINGLYLSQFKYVSINE